jgi:hypothetical protein
VGVLPLPLIFWLEFSAVYIAAAARRVLLAADAAAVDVMRRQPPFVFAAAVAWAAWELRSIWCHLVIRRR